MPLTTLYSPLDTINHISMVSPPVRTTTDTLLKDYIPSISYSQNVLPVEWQNRIAELRESYQVPDWDGEGADPISLEASLYAETVLEQIQVLIPGRVQPEDITVANTGNIMIDVYKTQERQALLTVTASGHIAYAYRYDSERLKGYCPVGIFKFNASLRTLLMRLA